MENQRVEQSNPFSTGGGGTSFEISVQSYFAACMLMGWKIPGLKDNYAKKIKLQGRYEGFNTDDCIIYSDNKHKLLCQIKHTITITKEDATFKEVMEAAWNDFNNADLFDMENDRIALVVSGLSATDISNTRFIFQWAGACENAEEFMHKMYLPKFSSAAKQKKFEIIREHLERSNRSAITDEQIWQFLKHFFILTLELDTLDSAINAAIGAGMHQFSNDDNFGAKVYQYIANLNQNAGTIAQEQLSRDLNVKIDNSEIVIQEYTKIKEHNQFIIANMRNQVADINIERSLEIEGIHNELEKNDIILVTGERGVGKSGVIKEFIEDINENTYCILLRAEELNVPHLHNVFANLEIWSSIEEISNSASAFNEKFIFIESLEKILEHDNTKAFYDLLLFISKQVGWKLIASVRDYAMEQIIMNFISDYCITYSIIDIPKFSEDQIRQFCADSGCLNNIGINTELLELMRNPFYLECIYKTVNGGYKIKENETKLSIKNAIWTTVIEKFTERAGGLPLKRGKCFIAVALKRAKTMRYIVNVDEFDEEVIIKLESDGLLMNINGMISLSHDILEDWAIEKFIEKQYMIKEETSYAAFFNSIGCEQAICRAYRLWLIDKFEDKIFAEHYIQAIFHDDKIRNIWIDETLAAIINSGRLKLLLSNLRTLLFKDDCALLKKICFLIRVTAKKSDMTLAKILKGENDAKWSSLVILKPYGSCWNDILVFLYGEKDNLPDSMYIHCKNLLDEWSSLININNELPDASREAGLLALFIIEKIKDDYSSKEWIKKLFSVAMMTYKEIAKEFTLYIESTVFDDKKRKNHSYIDELAEQLITSFNCIFVAKYSPELLIKVAKREWLLSEQTDTERRRMQRMYYSGINDEELYGLCENKIHDYFPASGAREPFRSLFVSAPKKALDFVIELCNSAAEGLINYEVRNCENKEREKESIICTIKKQDGNIIRQYCWGGFWGAYRGISNVPYIIQSALMALENWLLEHFEACKNNKEELDYCIDYLMTESNSVFITAVLASVAIPYYKHIGDSVLLLLQSNDFYSMDISRSVHEMGGNEINWFAYNGDPMRNLYKEDRKKAALQEWRKEHLEELCVKLQFTEMREKVLTIIDELGQKCVNLEEWRFRKHRIDTREFTVEYSEEMQGVILTSGELKDDEEDLKEISRQTQKRTKRINRFIAIMTWANDAVKGKAEFNIFESPIDIYKELRELVNLYPHISDDEKIGLYLCGLLQTACVLYRDYRTELSDDEVGWCKDFLIEMFVQYDDSLENVTGNGRVDITGLWPVAEILPLFSEFLIEEDLIKLMIIGLTCCDIDIRINTAKGISKYLWDRNYPLVEKCILVSNYFDIQDMNKRKEMRRRHFQSKEVEEHTYKEWLNEIRTNILEEDTTKLLVDESALSLFGITVRMLMLSPGFNNECKNYVSATIIRVSEAEEQMNDYRNRDDGKVDSYYDVVNYNTEAIGSYIYQLDFENVADFKAELEAACEKGPMFMKWILLRYNLLCEQDANRTDYWKLWAMLSDKMKEISDDLCKGENYRFKEQREMLNEYMYVNTPWQPIDYKNQPIKEGVDLICNFVKDTAKNPIVFEGITSLQYHFPMLILNKGLVALVGLSEDDVLNNLKRSHNSVYYLENVLHSYIMNYESNVMPVNIYNVCERLLDALVDMASSKAYYVREYMIKSKHIG